MCHILSTWLWAGEQRKYYFNFIEGPWGARTSGRILAVLNYPPCFFVCFTLEGNLLFWVHQSLWVGGLRWGLPAEHCNALINKCKIQECVSTKTFPRDFTTVDSGVKVYPQGQTKQMHCFGDGLCSVEYVNYLWCTFSCTASKVTRYLLLKPFPNSILHPTTTSFALILFNGRILQPQQKPTCQKWKGESLTETWLSRSLLLSAIYIQSGNKSKQGELRPFAPNLRLQSKSWPTACLISMGSLCVWE